MSSEHSHALWVIVITLFIAFCLSLVRLPEWLEWFRPEFVLLVLVYWCLYLPTRLGVGVAWFVGLVQDILEGTLLGQHALLMALVIYFVVSFEQRLRHFSVWQQSLLMVLPLTGAYALFNTLIISATGKMPSDLLLHLLPAVVSLAVWPIIYLIVSHFHRYFEVS